MLIFKRYLCGQMIMTESFLCNTRLTICCNLIIFLPVSRYCGLLSKPYSLVIDVLAATFNITRANAIFHFLDIIESNRKQRSFRIEGKNDSISAMRIIFKGGQFDNLTRNDTSQFILNSQVVVWL